MSDKERNAELAMVVDGIAIEDRIASYAIAMLMFWKEKIDSDDIWKNREAKQAYHDSLLQMKRLKLIDDYSVTNLSVTVLGHKYTENPIKTVFVPHGKPRKIS